MRVDGSHIIVDIDDSAYICVECRARIIARIRKKLNIMVTKTCKEYSLFMCVTLFFSRAAKYSFCDC